MAEHDLKCFLHKVEQLQNLVDSLDKVPGRRKLLSDCQNHNQVVELAKSWGYEIGRRWGEPEIGLQLEKNLLAKSIPKKGQEEKYLLKESADWRLELIVSCNFSNEEGFWYDQREHEWILLLRGNASLKLKNPDVLINLSVGDNLYLTPHRMHRVERTDPEPGTVWLTLLWK